MKWWGRSKKQQYYLWRKIDSEGNVLDVLLQRQRDAKAVEQFFCKLLKKQDFLPRIIVTDKLKSYEATKKRVLKSLKHRQHKGKVSNQAEKGHQPTQTRGRRMHRFKSSGQAQRFLSAFEPIREHFHPKQHELSALRYRKQYAKASSIGEKLSG